MIRSYSKVRICGLTPDLVDFFALGLDEYRVFYGRTSNMQDPKEYVGKLLDDVTSNIRNLACTLQGYGDLKMTALLFNTDSAYSNEHYTSIKKADINWKRYLGRDYALLSSEEEDVAQEGIALSRIEIGGRSDSHKHPQAEGFLSYPEHVN